MPLTQLDASPAVAGRAPDRTESRFNFSPPQIGETTTTDEVLKRLQETAGVAPDVVVAK
jgi:hypothetical protein